MGMTGYARICPEHFVYDDDCLIDEEIQQLKKYGAKPGMIIKVR